MKTLLAIVILALGNPGYAATLIKLGKSVEVGAGFLPIGSSKCPEGEESCLVNMNGPRDDGLVTPGFTLNIPLFDPKSASSISQFTADKRGDLSPAEIEVMNSIRSQLSRSALGRIPDKAPIKRKKRKNKHKDEDQPQLFFDTFEFDSDAQQ